ncbi:hypothetical protein SDRG_08149 [Saprolegnia diclina VS20]|uniref:Bromo domain-containing protein n=1 Tax=Saprolegnia diclina (strain VS20) TaxID=1156394 RepID=T0RPF4_SAPDV|nr:hypothetical protein SDRG_08149 [Saprolegnia diclina VS20]EQC34378.1 hypothetical protein SDRG_08149 [Saprolegnia diclina VS20]|eukprot:XP_008612240.1 hypothetical protein SDRG_08149 [Saprolegnia diclina VS20]
MGISPGAEMSSTATSPSAKEKERISQAAHDECMHVLSSLLQHEALRKATLSSAAKTALLEGAFADIQHAPSELRSKLLKKSMGLEKVQSLLGTKPSRCRFKTCEKFAKDVRVVFHNVLALQNYWKDQQSPSYDAILYHTTQKLLQDFERLFNERLSPHIARAPSSSPEPTPPSAPTPAPVAAPSPPPATAARLDDDDVAKCQAIVQKIMKYKDGGMSLATPFFNPVDLTLYVDYKIKVPHRMHLFGVQQKLSTGSYASLVAFAYDMRLIFSNCLVYNADVILSGPIRDHAVKLLQAFESLMLQSFGQSRNTWPGLADVDRWKCHQILHDILAHRTKQGLESAQWFKYPIHTYFESEDQIPFEYFKIVKKPMDIGTVSARLHLGEYKELAPFVSDLRRVFENCIKYWKNNPDGKQYYSDGKTLLSLFKSKVTAAFGPALLEDRKSSKHHHSHSHEASAPPAVPSSSKPAASSSSASGDSKGRRAFQEKDTCLNILQLIRKHTMRGLMGEILTAGPFLVAVDVTKYPDYLAIVPEPMDFAKIERKLKSNRYSHVSEFAADVHLIFSNCMKYNSDPVEGADIRTMANSLRDYFVSLYAAMERGEPLVAATVSSSFPPPPTATTSAKPRSTKPMADDVTPVTLASTALESHSDSGEKKKKKDKKDKKEKKKKKDKKDKKKDKKDKPRSEASSSSAPPPVVAVTVAAPIPVVVPEKASRKGGSSASKASSSSSKSKVKLDLSPWETSCERILSRLSKIESVHLMHFDVPLLRIFPDLAASYERVVTEPMDLGTMRQRLLAHQLPSAAEFVRLGHLVFANAEAFNVGSDSSSIRVREMAAHLRWFFDSMCMEHKLLDAELRLERRNERFLGVQTLRFTESKPNKECSKVLRVLLSQKYQKYAWPFVEPVEKLFPGLPPKYFEIITKPMDLKTVSEKLTSLTYKTYGEFIADIRLTFENALLYNIAEKGKEGPTVYSAGEKMLHVAMDQWGDVTIDIIERSKRSVLLHKEAQLLAAQNRAANEAAEAAAEADRLRTYQAKLEQQKIDEAAQEERSEHERSLQASVAAKAAKEARASLLSMEKMTKSERKIEEKKRKKAKKDEEAARSEKRRRTATLATEEALREAEHRSRLRQKAKDLLDEARAKQEALRHEHLKFAKPKRKAPECAKAFWKVKRRMLVVAPCFSAA